MENVNMYAWYDGVGAAVNTAATAAKSKDTKSTTTKATTTKDPNKASGYDWATGILSILVGAAPAVIAATKGGQAPTPWNSGADAAYGGNNDAPPQAPPTGVPMWVWIVVGVAVAGGLFAIFQMKKPQ
jgi:hypothetical protein